MEDKKPSRKTLKSPIQCLKMTKMSHFFYITSGPSFIYSVAKIELSGQKLMTKIRQFSNTMSSDMM